ncbi:FG-GAP-like repeat-containing protein [Streptomyces sp. NBC_00236]|uniref:FG-GAP-like repeat-containing protein n=1 Tax=Streptomyces sp. NBC_00236 TaxID=2903639 RepID=UPI002E2C1E28|nr:FG-GAP-like repeat-containing protein [Streptomyces sp. NBC_00236]
MGVRNAVAVVAAIVVGAGFVPLNAGPARAAAGTEVVFPADVAAQPRTVIPLSAGPTGYLRYEEGRGQFWSTYSGENHIIYNDLEGPEADGTYGAGADVVAAYRSRGAGQTGEIRLFDVAAGRNSYLALPVGHEYVGTYGTTVVTHSRTSPTAAPEWHLLRLVNGSVQDTEVVGWPEGAERPLKAVTGGADGVLVQYGRGAVLRPLWISLSTGVARPVGPDVPVGSASTVVSRDHVVEWTKDGKATVYAKDSTSQSGPLAVSQVVGLPYAEGDRLLGLAGDQLVVARASGQGGSTPYRLVTVPLDGGPEKAIFAYGRADAMPTPDGGLLVVAGSTPDGLGVQLIRSGAGGPTVGKLTDVTPATSRPHDLSFSQGTLESLEFLPDQLKGFRSRTVSVSGPLAVTGTGPAGDRGFDLADCGDSEGCPTLLATGDGRSVIMPSPNGGGDQMPSLVGPGGAEAVPLSVPGLSSFHVEDVSGRYALGRGSRADGSHAGFVTVDLDTGTLLASMPFSGEYADLYGDRVWGAGAVAGTVVSRDARTGTVKETVDLGSGCKAEDIKVTSHWLSWDCAGLPARGGVFDLEKKTNLTHLDPVSVLGDGFVGWRNGDDVRITDVRGATPVPVHTYSMAGDGEREQQYAIDTGTGRIAYQREADGDITVADLGIPASPMARIDSDVPASATVRGGVPSWAARWWLSKPAASWQLTLKSRATGATVRTLVGGEARGSVKAVWDGKDAAGRFVANGAYDWRLSAKPADGQGADLTASGSVKLSGSAAVLRDFVGNDGFGDLLAFTSAGVADFRGGTGDGTGAVHAKVSGSGWTGANTVTAAVPFGDVNGDRCNDVLVRVKSGELRAYKPSCGGALKPTTAFTKIGLGWNIYDALTSPGDLTGDGRADVIARETSTGYLYLYEQTSAGAFKARVKIGTGWKGYLLAGAGDLNGDGRGDLLARDAAGVLWRYAGTGKGTLAARVKVGGGWQVYNSLVGVGDVSGDGKADLLARDTAGVLWSYRGDGKGLFGYRAKVGGGWQMYSRLY